MMSPMGLECKSRKSRNTWSNRQILLENTKWSRAKVNRVLPRECTGQGKYPLPTTHRKTLHMTITRWSILKRDWLYSSQPNMEKLYQFSSVQSLSRVRLFATPWIAARQASLAITISWSSLRLTSIESMMPSSHLILGRPLLFTLYIKTSFPTQKWSVLKSICHGSLCTGLNPNCVKSNTISFSNFSLVLTVALIAFINLTLSIL